MNPASKPDFNASGVLAPGIHDCDLDQLKSLVCTNEYRRWMFYRFIGFLAWPLFVPGFTHVYVAGSFLSTKPRPEDVDVILQTQPRYGPESFAIVERFFTVGLDRIRAFYSVDVHFWMEGAPTGMADYRAFFQYGRDERRPAFDPAQQGIVRLTTDSITLETLGRHFSPFIPE